MALPLTSVWLRTTQSQRDLDLYYLESVPVLGKESHVVAFKFVSGLLYLVASMCDHALYTRAWYAAAEGHRPKGLWAAKAAASWFQKNLLLLQIVMSIEQLVSFLLFLVVILTVDPYTPLALLATLLTVVFTGSSFLKASFRLRGRLKKAVEEKYVQRLCDRLREQLRQVKIQAKDELAAAELSSHEIERQGLGIGRILTWAVVMAIAAGLVLLLVARAQGMIFRGNTSGIQGLISTGVTCAALIKSRLKSSAQEKDELDVKLSSVDETVAASIGQAERKAKQVEKKLKKLKKYSVTVRDEAGAIGSRVVAE